MFPKIKVPQNGWFIIYNGKPYEQMDDLGGTPIFGNTHMFAASWLYPLPIPIRLHILRNSTESLKRFFFKKIQQKDWWLLQDTPNRIWFLVVASSVCTAGGIDDPTAIPSCQKERIVFQLLGTVTIASYVPWSKVAFHWGWETSHL